MVSENDVYRVLFSFLVIVIVHSEDGSEFICDQGHAWISRASKSRRSVWKVGDKQPGTLSLVGTLVSDMF